MTNENKSQSHPGTTQSPRNRNGSRIMIAMISGHTCGPACWEAREDVCRCECGGKNHGCLRSANGIQPVRRTKIQGESYSLEAVGLFPDLEPQAISANEAAGVTFRYAYQPHAKFCNPVVRLKAATQAQVDAWPELASYRDLPAIIRTPFLLWKRD